MIKSEKLRLKRLHIRVGNILENVALIPPLRVFEGDPQKTLKANPHSHLEILALNLKNSALILTSNFEGF